MQRRSAPGRRFAAIWAVALLAACVIAVSAMPASAQTHSPRVASSKAAWTKTVFKALGKGAASAIGEVAAGWGLDAMGLSAKSSDELAALQSINGNLETIINELAGMRHELQQLNATLQQLNCDWLSSNLTEWLARIDSLATTYQAFNDVAAGTHGTPTVPPLASMTTWADQVTNDVTGVAPALHAIGNALMPSGSGQGIIRACLQPGVIHPPAAGTFGDTAYYDHVANLVDYYYAYQVRGLLLLQEAYHFQAEQASGQSPPPDSPGEICTKATDPRAILACTLAINYTNHVYQRLAHQFALAGLPFTTDKLILQNNGGPNPPLYVRSLESFTNHTGMHCPTPLTSAHPCGVTIPPYGDVTAPMQVPYDGYHTWWPATRGELDHLVSGRGSQTAGQYLNSEGFKDAGNKVLLTPQTVTFHYQFVVSPFLKRATVHARCFLDTDTTFGVACSEGVFKSHVLGGGPETVCSQFFFPSVVDRASLPSNRNGFYTAWLHADPHRNCDYHFDPRPGWLLGNTGLNTRQFRWPVLRVESDLTCTDGRSPVNPGGVPTRCGTNFDTMFETLVPRPETCLGKTSDHCARIGVETRGAVLRRGRVRIRLDCARASKACSGRLSLTARVWRRVHRRVGGHVRTYPVDRRITIGHRRYRLRAGHSSALTVRIAARGKRALEASRHDRLRVRVSATIHGGGGSHRQVVVSLARRSHILPASVSATA